MYLTDQSLKVYKTLVLPYSCCGNMYPERLEFYSVVITDVESSVLIQTLIAFTADSASCLCEETCPL